MLVEAKLGAEVEILSAAEQRKELAALADATRRGWVTPVTSAASVVLADATEAMLVIPGPRSGWSWDLRRSLLLISGGAAASAGVLISEVAQGAGASNPDRALDAAAGASLPYVTAFGRHQSLVEGGRDLACSVVLGAATTATLTWVIRAVQVLAVDAGRIV